MTPTIQQLSKALQDSWRADTAYNPEEWSENNKARGHCLVSCLIVQDYFGGDLISYQILTDRQPETHHMNQLPDGIVIDMTASQYPPSVNTRRKSVDRREFATIRDKRLADESTASRYKILKLRVEQQLNVSI